MAQVQFAMLSPIGTHEMHHNKMIIVMKESVFSFIHFMIWNSVHSKAEFFSAKHKGNDFFLTQ